MENGELKRKGSGKSLGARWRRGLRLLYLRLLRLRGKPEKLAGGVAIGVAVGLTPTVPLHLILAILAAFLLGKSKLAAALGSQVGNPFFLPFIYFLDYKVGQTITGSGGPSLEFPDVSASHILNLGWDIYHPLLVGGGVVGLVSVLPAYLLTKKLLLLSRERRRKRLEQIAFSSKTT